MKNLAVGEYRRISKCAAEKLYEAGGTVRICPVKISPVNAWGFFADCRKDIFTPVSDDGFNTTVARSREFQTVVNAFSYYNCNAETGGYPAFYTKES